MSESNPLRTLSPTRRVAFAALGLWIATAGLLSAAPDQYLCIEDLSVGIRYVPATRSWTPQFFTGGAKFVLRRLKGAEREGKYPANTPDGFSWLYPQKAEGKSDWGFFPFGEQSPLATCDASFQCTATSALFLHFFPDSERFEVTQQSG
jgi:hypothetical protein